MGIEQGYEVWQKAGVAALFLLLFLSILAYLLKELKSSAQQNLVMTEKVIKALEASTDAGRAQVETMTRLSAVISESGHQTESFLAYMKARDQWFGLGERDKPR